jgi:hypothetical protein
MTEEEKKKYTQKSYTTGSTSSYTSTFKHEPVKEKSLRITVKGSGNAEPIMDDGNVPPS